MDQHQNIPTPASAGGRGNNLCKSGKKIRNDILFIIALLVTVAVIGVGFFLFRKEGSTVIVTVDGQTFGTYSLSENRVLDIVTGDEELNRLVIQDGRAYVETATCPDGICSSHRPISRKGESIVCLPHKVVITVTDTQDEGPDIVA